MADVVLAGDCHITTVRVPISIRRRGGRKLVLAPDGTTPKALSARHIDNAMVKALARAFRWRDMLETSVYSAIAEIATAEKINAAYVGRVLRLTLLAPAIVEAILAGGQPAGLRLDDLLQRLPFEWREQRAQVWRLSS